MASASEVPGRYDVVINSQGYIFDRTRESTLYGSRARAEYSYTPTFLERTNVSGAYGDNQQDFWMTVSQKDWSLGEGQLYFHPSDANSASKYNTGRAIDTTTVPGLVFPRYASSTLTPSAQSYASCAAGPTIGTNTHVYVDATNLRTITSAGVDASSGAHGSGTPNQWGMCNDGVNVYIAGSTRITKWTGSGFSSFSATANAGSLAFLNNALYSCDGSTLNTYDGTGTKTTLFTWKDATNTALTALAKHPKLVPFGGKLLIFWPWLYEGPELWIYDGVSTSRVAVLPDSMVGYDVHVLDGIVFMSGLIQGAEGQDGLLVGLPTIHYYANGNIGELWRGQFGAGSPSLNNSYMTSLGDLGGKLLWADNAGNGLHEYDPASGAISNVANWTSSGAHNSSTLPRMSTTPLSVIAAVDGGNASSGDSFILYPGSSGVFDTSAYIQSSLIDFESGLSKTFRSIKVETQDAASGFDIYYSVTNGFNGMTLLQSAASSGTEYTFPANTQGRSISIKIVLNSKILQRFYVRAVPVLQSFRVRTYNLDLTSTPEMPTQLQDGATHPLTGHDQAANLVTAITSSTPISITDRFGTYTAVIEPGQSSVLELHSSSGGGNPAKSGQFIATIVAREV